MPLTPNQVAAAALESTRIYIELLEAQSGNEQWHSIEHIKQSQLPEIRIDGIIWPRYQAMIDTHLHLADESFAKFVGHNHPAGPIEIKVMRYDRMSGFLDFVAQAALDEDAGHLVVSFIWLVRRVEAWLSTKGSEMKSVTALRPLSTPPQPRLLDGLSDQQKRAVKIMLDSALSYVWGPPGTGKTQYVLARAVTCCYQNNEKILVVGPTNLAVDNALTAILQTGVVEQSEVLRLGIPTDTFLKAYPKCCEDKAFAAEIQALQNELHELEKRMAAIRQPQANPRAAAQMRANQSEIQQCEARIAQLHLELASYQKEIASKRILGMTLDKFIGYTISTTLSRDRVFVDEAAYAPLIKVLPLLMLGVPIALLGDHKQLPPVCENEDDAEVKAYWKKRAIFLEDVFEIGDDSLALNGCRKPTFPFGLFRKSKLTTSYRFPDNFAQFLDRWVYKAGLVGSGNDPMKMEITHCIPREINGRLERQNHAEVDAIARAVGDWLGETAGLSQRLAVLTPYKNQSKLIRDRLAREFRGKPGFSHVEVWNTHQAQGREWDCVFFSASDTSRLQGNDPWFCDSNEVNSEGLELLNTTLSRAKKHLRIFVDAEFWANRHPNSMLTDLVRTYPPHSGS